MGEFRTTREALIAQMLGELDGLLARAERLPDAIEQAETRLAATGKIMHAAGENYRLAVTAFTEAAKSTLTQHLQEQIQKRDSISVEEQRAILLNAAREAFRYEALERAAKIQSRNEQCASSLWRIVSGRLLEHLVTATLASILTAVVVLVIIKYG